MHLFKRFIATPLLAPEDGAMAGGADPGAEGTADAGFDGGDGNDADGFDDGASDGDGTQARGDDDEDLDLIAGPEEDDDAVGRPAEERLRNVLKKFRKARRQLAKFKPLADRLKGVDVDEVLQGHRQFLTLRERLATNKRLQRLLIEDGADGAADDQSDDAPAGRGADRGRAVEEFDESTLPFDPNASPSNRYFADFFKRHHATAREQERMVRTLSKRIEQLEGGLQQRDQRVISERWQNELNAALSQIKGPDRVMVKNQQTVLKDLVTAAFRLAPKGTDPKKVIAHYSGLLGIKPTQGQLSAAQAKQRAAIRNASLPRTGGGAGVPTPARGKKESIADVTRRIRQSLSG